MKVLELFKGTGSIGKWIEKKHPDWEVVSLDILPKFNPTICSDIMDWDYKTYPIGHFDIIWASPECKVYSTLQQSLNLNRWGKTKEEAKANLEKTRREHDKFVLRTLDIIEYFKPSKWFIENPWTSNMKNIPQLQALKSNRFDYCRFGFDYQKPTRIWSNVDLDDMKCDCFRPKLKPAVRRHKLQVGVDSWKGYEGEQIGGHGKQSAYPIPEQLVEHLIDEPKRHKRGIGLFDTSDPRSVNKVEDKYQVPEKLVEHLIDEK